jgi:tRNA (guanosine-2'-O-)-methyltransferase
MAHPNAATPEEMRALVAARRSDDPTWFEYGDEELEPARIIEILNDYLTDRRREEIEGVLDGRTLDVAVVVEGMVDLGNVSAIMRSAEAFGFQAIHAIDTSKAFKRSRRTTRGADKWLDRYRWEDSESCLSSLSADGFRIVLADTTPGAVPLVNSDLTGRVALVFGNERDGISAATRDRVDELVRIPMGGFVESLNVSVAASIVLHEVHRQRDEDDSRTGGLSPADRDRIRAVWYLKSVRESEAIVQREVDRGRTPVEYT